MPESAHPDETMDVICNGRIRFIQKRKGYRFSMDPILLANFVRLRKGERLLDIGTGCGIIPLYLAGRGCENSLHGVEVQEELFRLAIRNKELNGCENVRFTMGDVRSSTGQMSQSFNVVVSNPPYVSVGTGRQSPGTSRRLARQESLLDLPSLLGAASRLLEKKGRLYLIYPARRLSEIVYLSRSHHLEPKRIRFIHPRMGEDANLFLLECGKDGGAGIKVEEPLHVYEGDDWTAEVRAYYS